MALLTEIKLHTPTPACCRGFIHSEEGVVLPATTDLNEQKLLLTLNSRIGNNTAPAQQVFFFGDEGSAANKLNLGFTADWFLERACEKLHSTKREHVHGRIWR
jgi:hypothetical protein